MRYKKFYKSPQKKKENKEMAKLGRGKNLEREQEFWKLRSLLRKHNIEVSRDSYHEQYLLYLRNRLAVERMRFCPCFFGNWNIPLYYCSHYKIWAGKASLIRKECSVCEIELFQ